MKLSLKLEMLINNKLCSMKIDHFIYMYILLKLQHYNYELLIY